MIYQSNNNTEPLKLAFLLCPSYADFRRKRDPGYSTLDSLKPSQHLPLMYHL